MFSMIPETGIDDHSNQKPNLEHAGESSTALATNRFHIWASLLGQGQCDDLRSWSPVRTKWGLRRFRLAPGANAIL
jgi:hypothetical protein